MQKSLLVLQNSRSDYQDIEKLNEIIIKLKNKFNFDLSIEIGMIGQMALETEGTALPTQTIERSRAVDAVLMMNLFEYKCDNENQCKNAINNLKARMGLFLDIRKLHLVNMDTARLYSTVYISDDGQIDSEDSQNQILQRAIEISEKRKCNLNLITGAEAFGGFDKVEIDSDKIKKIDLLNYVSSNSIVENKEVFFSKKAIIDIAILHSACVYVNKHNLNLKNQDIITDNSAGFSEKSFVCANKNNENDTNPLGLLLALYETIKYAFNDYTTAHYLKSLINKAFLSGTTKENFMDEIYKNI